MADQITDQRTLLDAADAVTNFVDLGGGAAGTLDTEIKIQGTGSVGYSTSNTRSGLLYNAGSAQDWSNSHFYLWVNCGIVGLLDTKANGGLTIRFCGATVTDWFEVRIAGSDDWPASVAGGWTMFVVDIETARSTAVTNGWTNGTPPATTAIQYVGISTITGGTMPRMVDNTWLDAMWRLPDGTPGIRVEGRNGGTTDWRWADVLSTAVANAWGMARSAAGGGVALNAPVQFFVDDGSTHGFTSTNEKILWENQEFVAADHYGITVLGAATGTANWKMGVKSGTGVDATGAQGGIIAAASSGVRWFFDADAANIGSCGLYGITCEHGSDFQLDGATVETTSCLFIDCQSARVDNSTFLKNGIINAATADGVAFVTTDDLGDVQFCEFQFSDGHAISVVSGGPQAQTSQGNVFSGYGANDTNDAAISNDRGAQLDISLTGGGSGTSDVTVTPTASTTVSAAFDFTMTGLPQDTRVVIVDSTSRNELFTAVIDATGEATYTHGGGALVDVLFHANEYEPDISNIYDFTLPNADQTRQIAMFADLDYGNPP